MNLTKYQLFQYQTMEGCRVGMVVHDNLYDLDRCLKVTGFGLFGDRTLDQMLENWAVESVALSRLAREISTRAVDYKSAVLKADEVSYAPPLLRPGAIYGAGANYRDHVIAMSKALNMTLSVDPKGDGIAPWHFSKAGHSCLIGHDARLPYPKHTKKLDWEAELAVIIGRRARHLTANSALDCVADYTCANDLSARDNFRRDQVDISSPFRFDWMGHKCFVGSCPLGPWLTPREFVETPENLNIKLRVNGVLRQDSNTSNHLYSVADQLIHLSGLVELQPGDIILTGTPAGVGIESGTFLAPGDTMEVWIEGLGSLKTSIS